MNLSKRFFISYYVYYKKMSPKRTDESFQGYISYSFLHIASIVSMYNTFLYFSPIHGNNLRAIIGCALISLPFIYNQPLIQKFKNYSREINSDKEESYSSKFFIAISIISLIVVIICGWLFMPPLVQ